MRRAAAASIAAAPLARALLLAILVPVISPGAARSAPAIRQVAGGPPEALRSELILDRATLESWGVPRPSRLAFDGDGALYILDVGRRRVVKVGPDGSRLHEIALSGDDPASTVEPADLLVDARGSVLVLDRAGASILAFDKSGSFLAARPLAPDLAEEARDPRASLLQDAFGRLWLLAPRDRDLIRLDASLARGRAARFLTPEDSLGAPGAVAATPNGETWIADLASGALRRFRSSGALAGAVGTGDPTAVAGSAPPAALVAALAADASGYVYAADALGQRILVYAEDGSRVLERVLGGSGHPWHPSALAWSPRDRLAAADGERGEVQVFAIERVIDRATESAPLGRAP